MLSMAALALIVASCSNDEENVPDNKFVNAEPIRISQQMAGVETKGAVTPGTDMQAVILMADGDNPDFKNFTPKTDNTVTGKDFTLDTDRANVSTTTFKATTDEDGIEISLTPTLYYPKTAKAWILGVSPQGAVDVSKVTFNDVDGLQDVMYAEKVDAGTAAAHTGISPLKFEHKTTQLTFVAKLAKELTGTEWEGQSVSVTSITVLNAKLPKSLTFSTGVIDWKETNVSVEGCKTQLVLTLCNPSIPLMISPADQVMVNLELSVGGVPKTYTNLVVKNGNKNLATVMGKSHQITFEITPPVGASDATKITTSAKVTNWVDGDPGKVEIK